jgi:type IV pilus assembly protein PilA
MKHLKNKKGVTLIELLVIVVILGIIAAVAIPMVVSNLEEAQKSVDDQNKAIIQDAVNRYMAKEGEVPVEGDLVPDYLSQYPKPTTDGKKFTIDGDSGLVSIEDESS